MRVPASVASLHERFRSALTKTYFVRLHMTVMILLVLLSGLIASRLLLLAGLSHMGIRYPLAALISYFVFFGLIRIWIRYISRASRRSKGSGIDLGDFVSDGSGGFSGGSRAAGQLAEGGGKFGGGGASSSFVEGESAAARPAVVPVVSARSSGSSGSKSSSGFGLDLDGDGVWLLVLFALLVAAIFGAGVYLVYQAPVILSEAAFQTVLASGLVRTARNAHDPGWMDGVLRSTFLPFALVLVLSGVFGYQAHKRCAGAVTVRQVFRQCIFRR